MRRTACPDGSTVDHDVVVHPGAAAILPVFSDGRLLLVRQYRPAVEASLLEIPAGKIEPGESPLVCAQRELREETGTGAPTWDLLVACYTSPGISDERISIYRACPIARMTPADAGEIEEWVTLTPSEALQGIADGEIEDAKTILAICVHTAQGA